MVEYRNEWQKKKVVVIGAGIAGLTAAHYLRKQGVEAEIFERENSVGGSVRTSLKEEKYLVEMGPFAFPANAEPVKRLARELSIEPLIVGSEALSNKRCVYRKGKLYQLPTGPGTFLRSSLVSFAGKIRLMMEPFIRSKSTESETLAGFVLRRGGREILNALVDPFSPGVWAGDPSELEMASVLPKFVEIEQEYGSILRNMGKLTNGVKKKGLLSFKWGMGTLTARLEEELRSRIHLASQVEGVERRKDAGSFKIRLEGKVLPVEADAVVISSPASAAAKILMPLDPEIFKPLSSIPYAPLAAVHTAFSLNDVPNKLDGFGVLIPKGEKIRLLGSVWSSSMFPKRCPGSEALLINFIGGATDVGLLNLSDDEIIGEVISGLNTVIGIKTKPKFIFLKRLGQAIPQYTIGHRGRVGFAKSRLEKIPGIFLVGSYLSGVSVSDTIANARSEVDRVVSYLKTITKVSPSP